MLMTGWAAIGMAPGSSQRRTTQPSKGALTVLRARLSRAFSTAAAASATLLRDRSTAALATATSSLRDPCCRRIRFCTAVSRLWRADSRAVRLRSNWSLGTAWSVNSFWVRSMSSCAICSSFWRRLTTASAALISSGRLPLTALSRSASLEANPASAETSAASDWFNAACGMDVSSL